MQRSSLRLALFFILLIVFAAYTPLSSVAALIAPIPLALLFSKSQGEWKIGLTSLGVAFLLLGFTGAWLAVAVLIAATGGFAFILGRGLRTNSLLEAIPRAALIIVLLYVVGLAELKLSGVPVAAYIAKQANQFLQGTAQSEFLSGSSGSLFGGDLATQVGLYMPGIIVILSVFVTLFQVAILRLIKARDEQAQPILRHMRLPRWIVPCFAASLLAIIFNMGSNIPLLWELLNNVWMITTFLLTLQALSLVWWLLRCRLRYVWVICGLLVLETVPALSELLVIAGLVDILFDIRSRMMSRR